MTAFVTTDELQEWMSDSDGESKSNSVLEIDAEDHDDSLRVEQDKFRKEAQEMRSKLQAAREILQFERQQNEIQREQIQREQFAEQRDTLKGVQSPTESPRTKLVESKVLSPTAKMQQMDMDHGVLSAQEMRRQFIEMRKLLKAELEKLENEQSELVQLDNQQEDMLWNEMKVKCERLNDLNQRNAIEHEDMTEHLTNGLKTKVELTETYNVEKQSIFENEKKQIREQREKLKAESKKLQDDRSKFEHQRQEMIRNQIDAQSALQRQHEKLKAEAQRLSVSTNPPINVAENDMVQNQTVKSVKCECQKLGTVKSQEMSPHFDHEFGNEKVHKLRSWNLGLKTPESVKLPNPDILQTTKVRKPIQDEVDSVSKNKTDFWEWDDCKPYYRDWQASDRVLRNRIKTVGTELNETNFEEMSQMTTELESYRLNLDNQKEAMIRNEIEAQKELNAERERLKKECERLVQLQRDLERKGVEKVNDSKCTKSTQKPVASQRSNGIPKSKFQISKFLISKYQSSKFQNSNQSLHTPKFQIPNFQIPHHSPRVITVTHSELAKVKESKYQLKVQQDANSDKMRELHRDAMKDINAKCRKLQIGSETLRKTQASNESLHLGPSRTMICQNTKDINELGNDKSHKKAIPLPTKMVIENWKKKDLILRRQIAAMEYDAVVAQNRSNEERKNTFVAQKKAYIRSYPHRDLKCDGTFAEKYKL